MAKNGIVFPDIAPGFFRSQIKKRGWALCVGAGTSTPAFPAWTTLVQRLVARDVGEAGAEELTQNLLRRFSPDALIEAARDRSGCSEAEFSEVLAAELYRDIRTRVSESEWKTISNAMSAPNPGDMTRSTRQGFIEIIRHHYPGLSALTVAEIVAELDDTPWMPSAVISFNAEPLLLALISVAISNRVADGSSKITAKGEQRPRFDMVTHGTSDRVRDRVPYIFCHGLLPVPDVHRRWSPRAVDKLVFSEGSYLQLANSSFSWQSSVFLDVCAFRSVVFVGVSLSDPNMRRWLSWVHTNRIQELHARFGRGGPSTDHFWINKLPKSDTERQWIEASVAHLGVRLLWIPDWSQIGLALRAMLGL
jgi:hypothetical protein